MQEFFTIHKSISVTQHNYKLKNKSHMIISIDAAKAFDKIQHPFMINTLQKVERGETHLSIIRVIYDKSIANIFLRGEKLRTFSLRISFSQDKDVLFSPLSFNIQWGIILRQSQWPSSKNLQTVDTGEGVEKKKPSYKVDGDVNWYSYYGKHYGGPFKNGTTISHSWAYIQRK